MQRPNPLAGKSILKLPQRRSIYFYCSIVITSLDTLAKILPTSTIIRGLHDSGNYVGIPPLNPDLDASFVLQCERAYDTFDQPGVNSQCSEKYQGQEWKCLCGQYMLPLVQTPSQIIIYQYDSYQLGKNIGKCSLVQGVYIQRQETLK
jgi:hypothetical protein